MCGASYQAQFHLLAGAPQGLLHQQTLLGWYLRISITVHQQYGRADRRGIIHWGTPSACLRWWSLSHDGAAGLATLRTHVNDPVGGPDHIQLRSITMTMLPVSTSWCSTSSRRWMSAKCRPVVGSSRM
jgi:hypothetical protein